MQIHGKMILVSGGSSGLGAACVDAFANAGANVLILDLSSPTSSALEKYPDQILYCRGNVCDEVDVRRCIELGDEKFGNTMVGAVACAGILHSEKCIHRDGVASLEAFRRVIEINLIGTYNVVRLCAEAISNSSSPSEVEDKGVLVTTSSIAAFDGQIGQSAYSASKGGVAAMTLPLARDLGRNGIRVVNIAPGVFETPMMINAPENVRQTLLNQTVFPKRFGASTEFASTVLHVFENTMLNGCTIRLDGAMRMPPR